MTMSWSLFTLVHREDVPSLLQGRNASLLIQQQATVAPQATTGVHQLSFSTSGRDGYKSLNHRADFTAQNINPDAKITTEKVHTNSSN